MEPAKIKAYFLDLQQRMIDALRQLDPEAAHLADDWERAEGGGGSSQVFSGGKIIEKGGINFSHVFGPGLPPSATRQRPELANRPFEAMGVSVVFHPLNPFVPCTHLNVRFFTTTPEPDRPPVWWFGGGFDLTPVYPFIEDARAWHSAAARACAPFGPDFYPRFKAACDTYFFLPHRNETRGVGGLFFDDFNELGFEDSFAFTRSVGDAFMPAWLAIAGRRAATPFTPEQKAFQQYRRGRYVEFNLLYDRGTLFGIQSKGRTESVLMSLPPVVEWKYNYQPPADSPEAALVRDFLRPRDWLNEPAEPVTATS